MRILHVITGLGVGGAERALYNLLSGGLAQRFDCAVLSLRDEGAFGAPIRELGVPVSTLGIRRALPGPGALLRLRQLVRTFRPDVIQGWMYHGNLCAIVASLMADQRQYVVFNIRCSWISEHESLFNRLLIRANGLSSVRTSKIIYNSQNAREEHEHHGFSGQNSLVIPNGFETDIFKPDARAKHKMRSELEIPQSAFVFGNVARYHPMKDHWNFLRAAISVLRDRRETYIILVGRDITPENKALIANIPAHLMDRFRLLGEKANILPYLQAMDVFCLSSSFGEGFPNVICEAMSCGLPAVVTDVGDCDVIVGDTGIVVPPKDSDTLAEGLLQFRRRDARELSVLAKAARTRIKLKFSVATMVEDYIRMYLNIGLAEH